jgi:hypothetical protein
VKLGKAKSVTIRVYENDNPKIVAAKFGWIYSLSPSHISVLEEHIQQRMLEQKVPMSLDESIPNDASSHDHEDYEEHNIIDTEYAAESYGLNVSLESISTSSPKRSIVGNDDSTFPPEIPDEALSVF